MATLIEQCRALRGGLEQAHLANQTRHEISAFQERLREWEQLISSRQGLIEKMRFVDPTIRGELQIVETSAAAKALTKEARARLEAGGDVESLSVENLWARLRSATDAANSVVIDHVRKIWKAYIDTLGRVESPNTLENRILKTPTNEQLLIQYRAAHISYQTVIRHELPVNEDSRRVVFDHVEALRKIHSQMDTSAPDSVRRFLKAVESDGAALELVTPEVIKWLAENDDQNRFVVRLKVANTWR
ncbi:hypothetical protein CD175_15270 [Pseudomonas laurylsulfatiphila]|jgi:hypothetical protein|uniref:Uncharacterized protein n=1 Tax=Pseudomonas laurylsulfatiphila TaxID=2011015 RepID=A0A2S6FJM0_9PSED|nr:hypothetical protein [Pseudomonas laurylsulfatiphila]PPK37633.1 hypothetical protein CD175_15270 [Pseudomonas laurylsulfatiphila]